MFSAEKLQEIANEVGTPFFAYSEQVLRDNMRQIMEGFSSEAYETHLFPNAFANPHPELFRILQSRHIGAMIQSVQEVHRFDDAGLSLDMIATPGVVSKSDLEILASYSIPVNALSVNQFELLGDAAKKGIRVAYADSQQGIATKRFSEIDAQQVHAVHSYAKSDPSRAPNLNLSDRITHAKKVFALVSEHFPNAKVINLGGGFTVNSSITPLHSEYEGRIHFDWQAFGQQLEQAYKKAKLTDKQISIEPGTALLLNTGVYVASIYEVNHSLVHTNGSLVQYPNTVSGTRPNAVRFIAEGEFMEGTERVHLKGQSTLEGDYIVTGYRLAPKSLSAGHLVAVANMGAYAATKYSTFMGMQRPAEVLIHSNNTHTVISQAH